MDKKQIILLDEMSRRIKMLEIKVKKLQTLLIARGVIDEEDI